MQAPERAVRCAVVALANGLRRVGVATGIDEELTLCRALAEVDVRSREEVYWTTRATLVRRRDDFGAFDRVFQDFWDGYDLDGPVKRISEHGESDPRMPGPQHGGESLPQFRLSGRSSHVLDGNAVQAMSPLELPTAGVEESAESERRGLLAAYSPNEVLSEPGLLEYGRDELAAVRRLAEELRSAVPERSSRRAAPSRRRHRLDVRKTVQRSLATNGEPVALSYSGPSRRPRRLLFLCDVSGSMERYSRALLASLQAAVGAGTRAETFVFATSLTRLTGDLSGHDAGAALERARDAVSDWSGGTRIGRALAEFNSRYGGLCLARGAIVLIVSDGWDRGDPEELAGELARLRLQSRRLVWLNPRPAELDGQPLAVGMRAALPHIDDFVAGHDPRAVTALARLIGGLGAGRPARRQGMSPRRLEELSSEARRAGGHAAGSSASDSSKHRR